MKNIITLLVLILFTAGMAVAQDNNASINQVGDDHDAVISQTGDLNTAYVEQTADAGREGADIAEAVITQEGSSNLVNLRQRAFYGDNEATITQVGSGNMVHGMNQGAAFYQNHGLNIIDVHMEGDRNTLYTLAGEAQKNVNTFILDVFGSDNQVGMFQEFGYANIEIDGNYNEVVTNQRGGQASGMPEAFIDIYGDQNTVDVLQNGTGNIANVDVNGSFNSASITQN